MKKMAKRNFPDLSVVVVAAILLVACQSAAPPFECTDAIGCVGITPDEPIEIGALQVLSGEVSPLGTEQLRSTEVAIADRGEFLGHPIKLQTEDSLCLSEGGTTAAQKIATLPQIVAILGTTCSGSAVTAGEVMSEAGLVMVSGSNTAPSLTAVGGARGDDWQPGYFRTAHNDIVQGRAAATFAFQELGLTKAATINDGDTYTQGLTGVFGQVFAELGGEIVLDTAVNKGDTDMRPVLARVAVSGAELVFFPIFPPEGSFITLQAKEVEGLEGVTLMSADGLFTTTFIDATGVDGVGVYFVTPHTPRGPAYDTFVSKYRSEYGEAPTMPFHAHGYDAANLLLDAIETVAVQEKDGTLHIGRQALREALYATTGFQGLTGSLTCDEFGDCGAARFKVVRLDDPAAGIEGLGANVIYTYERERHDE
jgi:branched-chain amino acid transport system substrate-binding protein